MAVSLLLVWLLVGVIFYAGQAENQPGALINLFGGALWNYYRCAKAEAQNLARWASRNALAKKILWVFSLW